MSISMPRFLLPLTLPLLLILLSFGCTGGKSKTAAHKSRTPSTPPIYVDISGFEKPDCTTPDVRTKNGLLCGNQRGTSDGKAVNAYLGIPFAESTAGQNRWRAPVPKAAWGDVLRATRTGPACPQSGETTYPQSEECLFLNVWAPAEASAEPRAVMVFIYGGAFVYGYDALPLYDGAYTAGNGDVVVVNINYRVGALGFLSGVKDAKTGEAVNGNFGILDQIAALEWVRDNIAAFGGDPDKVTIYGESAGAMSVGIHLVSSPRSENLFRAAIMESNPLGLPYKNLKQSRAIAREFASNLGCGAEDLACMRAQPAEVVLDAQLQMDMALPALIHGIRDMLAWSPVVDGDVVVQQPIRAVEDGKLTKPVILGTNRNEGLVFVEVVKSGLGWKTVSDFDYHLAIDFFFRSSDLRKKIYAHYPANGHDNTMLISSVFTEYLFTCANLYAAGKGSPSTWSYIFNHVPSHNSWPAYPACGENVCHGAELRFVFHTAENTGWEFTPDEERLSELMVSYWTDFAKYLNPVRADDAWPAYSRDSESLSFVTPIEDIKTVTPPAACAFWDGVGYDLGNSFWGLF